MIRKYLLVEFHKPHRHPIGASNPIRLEQRPDMEMYRDLDVDPGTLVAVSAACTLEYPWGEVKQAVVKNGTQGAECSPTHDTQPAPESEPEVDVELDDLESPPEQEPAAAKRRPRTKEVM